MSAHEVDLTFFSCTSVWISLVNTEEHSQTENTKIEKQTAFWWIDSKDLTHFNFFTYQMFLIFRPNRHHRSTTRVLVVTAKIQNIYLATRNFHFIHDFDALEFRLIDGQVKLEKKKTSESLRKFDFLFFSSSSFESVEWLFDLLHRYAFELSVQFTCS